VWDIHVKCVICVRYTCVRYMCHMCDIHSVRYTCHTCKLYACDMWDIHAAVWLYDCFDELVHSEQTLSHTCLCLPYWCKHHKGIFWPRLCITQDVKKQKVTGTKGVRETHTHIHTNTCTEKAHARHKWSAAATCLLVPTTHLHSPSAAGDAFFAVSGVKVSFVKYLDLHRYIDT